MLINPAFAQEAAAVAADPALAAGNPMKLLFQFLIIFVVFYCFHIRPQQKRMKEQQAMQMAVSRGDTIITAGGIVGKVIRSNAEDLLVEIADGVRVTVVRDRVSAMRPSSVKTPASVEDDEPAKDAAKSGSEGLKDILTKK